MRILKQDLSRRLPCAARRQRIRGQPAQARASAATPYTGKAKPDWAGDDALSRFVNVLIGFKPLYSVMKVLAKRVLQQTAERQGVPWRQRAKDLSAEAEVFRLKEEIEDKDLQYPSYYLQQFHAYENGNLDWTAAFEAESATLAVSYRTWKDPTLSPRQALEKLRANIFGCLEPGSTLQGYQVRLGARAPVDILDVGCSVGVSARAFASQYPRSHVTGLDLSPHFLAVAEFQERTEEDLSGRNRIRYVHALGEATGLPGSQYDVVNLGFIIHECPPPAIEALIREAFRLLRPDGVLLISDNNPRSATIQNLSPVIFTLMKSTEPYSDQYFLMDTEAALRDAGFEAVVTEESDHRHRAVMGLKR